MKDEIYKTQISPLMQQIIDICNAHHIAFVASFSVPSATVPGLECVSAILEEECNPPPHLVCALGVIRGDLFITKNRAVEIDSRTVH